MKYFTAVIIVLIALTALVGWTYDVELLKRFDLRLVAMNPATALCLLMGTFATLLGQLPMQWRRIRVIALICAGFCITTGALKLTYLAFGWQAGPDTWLFTSKLTNGPGPANRMAPNTAANFLMIGIALVMLQLRRKVFAAQLIAAATALISMLAIVGYAYGIRTFYSVGIFIPMAVHTATSFLLLSGAVLYMRPTEGLMATITNDGPAGRTARILLPCAIVLPIGLGWLRLLGQRAGMYESEVGVSIFVMSNVLVFAILIWWNSRQLYKADLLRHAAEEHLLHVATHDFLTGLANRSLFMERLEHRLQLARRHPAMRFAVLYLDLDGFKQINDKLGHNKGDELLRQVATELLQCSRTTDLVARLGGDEFTILAEVIACDDDAEILAKRVLSALRRSLPYEGQTLKVGTSVGIVLFDPRYVSADQMLRDADHAMYTAKAQGKGRICIAAPLLSPNVAAE
jgi:diguanylate cyclase (GGDEF)-like protein